MSPYKFAAFLLTALFALAPVGLAQSHYVVSKPSKANVRELPAVGKPVMAKVTKGTRLRVIARTDTSDMSKLWLKVETPQGQVGWIAARITQYEKAAASSSMPMEEPTYDAPASLDEYDAGIGAETLTPPSMEEPQMMDEPAAMDDSGSMDDLPEIEILEDIDEGVFDE